MRVAFLGTPDVAVPALEALLAADDLDVVVVVTNPDRARGRSKKLIAPPVKVAAEAAGVPVLQPARGRDLEPDLAALDIDAAAVVAYGSLLPDAVLATARLGFVNLHFSLLPRWRGAAPVQHAVRSGDAVTGVTTFVLDAGMDTGPIVDQVEVAIEDESSGELLDRLAVLGAPVLVASLRALRDGAVPTPQPPDGATRASKITPDDVRIAWAASAVEIARLTRSADPAPGAHTTYQGKRLKIWHARPSQEPGHGEPGEVLGAEDDGVRVATADGVVVLVEVQPEGKARMAGAAFANGYRPAVGSVMGT